MTIGERIRRAREKCGISQTALAEKIGVAKQTLYKYEKGVITNIPSDKISLIADICECTPAFLMGWDESLPSDTEMNLPPYYLDPDTAAIAQEYHDRPDLKILFDATRGATPEDLKAAAAMIKALKQQREGE